MPNECESVTESGSVAMDATASEASVNARGSAELAQLRKEMQQAARWARDRMLHAPESSALLLGLWLGLEDTCEHYVLRIDEIIEANSASTQEGRSPTS